MRGAIWCRLAFAVTLAAVLLVVLAPAAPAAHLEPAPAAAAGAVRGACSCTSWSRGADPSLRRSFRRRLPRARSWSSPLRRRRSSGAGWCSASSFAPGRSAAVAGSTLGFALAHRARPGLHLGTGAAFGGLYLATGALAASIAAHWAYNVFLLALAERREVSRGDVTVAAELLGVTKRFGAVAALDDVSFAVGEGEVVALLGPNGAGKSTAISVLLGLRTPDAGIARLFGADPREPAARRLVGATQQESVFPSTLRVRELVDLVRAHYEHPLSTDTVSERFELGRIVGRQTGGLSGGERRRLGVALAFAGRPRLVVLDEPTAGLDREARARGVGGRP